LDSRPIRGFTTSFCDHVLISANDDVGLPFKSTYGISIHVPIYSPQCIRRILSLDPKV